MLHWVPLLLKREFDSIHMDRDTAHARRVNRTDFRGIGHPTLSLGSLRQSVVWGGVVSPLTRRKIETVAARHRIITGIT